MSERRSFDGDVAQRDSTDYLTSMNYFDTPLSLGSFLIYQIGRQHCKCGAVIKEHTHLNYFELTIVTAGAGTVVTNGHASIVNPGDIYLSFPGDFHKITSDEKDALKYNFCAFYTEEEDLKRSLLEITETHNSPASRIFRNEKIPKLVASAFEELVGDDEYAERLISLLFEELTVRLIREFSKHNDGRFTKKENNAKLLCYKMMNYIDTHIFELHSLYELSDVMMYNYNYLSNLFKEVTSGTLCDYYRTRKLETARLLLDEGVLSITKIASLLGYSSVYTFSRAFKEAYGIPPSAVR